MISIGEPACIICNGYAGRKKRSCLLGQLLLQNSIGPAYFVLTTFTCLDTAPWRTSMMYMPDGRLAPAVTSVPSVTPLIISTFLPVRSLMVISAGSVLLLLKAI